jgi:hypothetical protein
MSHHPVDRLSWDEAEQVHAIARHTDVIREGHHRNGCSPRNRRHRAHVLGQQGPENQAIAFRQRPVHGRPRARRRVVNRDPDPLAATVGQGQIGRVRDRPTDAGIGPAERHQHRNAIARVVPGQRRLTSGRRSKLGRAGSDLAGGGGSARVCGAAASGTI